METTKKYVEKETKTREHKRTEVISRPSALPCRVPNARLNPPLTAETPATAEAETPAPGGNGHTGSGSGTAGDGHTGSGSGEDTGGGGGGDTGGWG